MLQRCYSSRNCKKNIPFVVGDNLITVTGDPACLILFRKTFVTAVFACFIMRIIFVSTLDVLNFTSKNTLFPSLVEAQQHNLINLEEKRKSK